VQEQDHRRPPARTPRSLHGSAGRNPRQWTLQSLLCCTQARSGSKKLAIVAVARKLL